MDTDYDNYVSIYSCQDTFGLFKIEFAWILARDPNNFTQEMRDKALAAFTNQGLVVTEFEEVKQADCTYEDPSGTPACVP